MWPFVIIDIENVTEPEKGLRWISLEQRKLKMNMYIILKNERMKINIENGQKEKGEMDRTCNEKQWMNGNNNWRKDGADTLEEVYCSVHPELHSYETDHGKHRENNEQKTIIVSAANKKEWRSIKFIEPIKR